MERITMNICTDGYRSHRNGILPYVPYGAERPVIMDVRGESANGNFGHYVCDFAVFSGRTDVFLVPEGSTVTTSARTEIDRLCYLDVIAAYSRIQDKLRDCVKVRRYSVVERIPGKTECNYTGSTVSVSGNTRYLWRSGEDETEAMSVYSLHPLEMRYFTLTDEGYLYSEPPEFAAVSAKTEDERTDEENAIYESVMAIQSVETKNITHAVLVEDAYYVMKMNREWEEWWNRYGKDLRQEAFNGYSPSSAVFEFCDDIDRYVLGRVEVPAIHGPDGKISFYEGSRVPGFVYYTDVERRKAWFEKHSGTTVEAERNGDARTVSIWNEMGGGAFYDFLRTVTPLWQGYTERHADGIFFSYDPPRMGIHAFIDTDGRPEPMYEPYEYSVSANMVVSILKPFEKRGEGTVGSALTPDFVTFGDSGNGIMVESRLDSLVSPKAVYAADGIYGIYEEFEDRGSGRTGQMYECFYFSGLSSEPGKIHRYSGWTWTVDKESGIRTPMEWISGNTGDVESDICPLAAGYEQVFIVNSGSPFHSSGNVSDNRSEEVTADTGSFVSYTRKNYYHTELFYEYHWWGCTPVEREDLRCADDETVKSGEEAYRNVTILSSFLGMVHETPKVGDKYYFNALYRNGRYNPRLICEESGDIVYFGYPYITGEPMNVSTYMSGNTFDIADFSGSTAVTTYDMVLSVTENQEESSVTIDYVIGAESGKTSGETGKTGIHYRETLPYYLSSATVYLDGVYEAELYFKQIDTASTQEYVYSDEYRLFRKARRAEITGMEVGSIWTSGGAVDVPLFTKEGTDGLMEAPKISAGITYNRGSAAAWETHFKIAECNTMDDLEKYGNNSFNI